MSIDTSLLICFRPFAKTPVFILHAFTYFPLYVLLELTKTQSHALAYGFMHAYIGAQGGQTHDGTIVAVALLACACIINDGIEDRVLCG